MTPLLENSLIPKLTLAKRETVLWARRGVKLRGDVDLNVSGKPRAQRAVYPTACACWTKPLRGEKSRGLIKSRM